MTSRYAPSQQGVEVGIEAQLKRLGHRTCKTDIFRGFGTKRARLGTFRGFGTERARLGTFRGFGTERARLGTFKKKSLKKIFFT